MKNESIDFQNLKRIKHFSPLFQHCSKAIPISGIEPSSSDISDFKKTFSYIVIPKTVQIQQKLFQCKSLCPIFNCGSQSLILTKGENLWDFYRAKKQNEIILTEQEIWILIKQISQALLQLQTFGYFHIHLKEYAIYRQSPYSYQLVYHPEIKSMLQLSHQNNSFYWYDFYLSPEELKSQSVDSFKHTSKESVFSLGLLVLNVMNAQNFNRIVYSKKNYEVDWILVKQKIDDCKRKFSEKLINLVRNCLKESPEQRYGLRELHNEAVMIINQNRSLNLEFKAKFDQLIMSRLRSTENRKSSKVSDSRKKSDSKSREKSLQSQSPVKSSPQKRKTPLQSKEKQKIPLNIQKEKKSANLQNQPPKKWKVTSISQKKPYSIAKPNNTLLQEKQFKDYQQTNKKSLEREKVQRNQKQKEDVINFERGTFGGEQSSQLSSFSSSKFQKEIKIQIESIKSSDIENSLKDSIQQSSKDNFQEERMITFGSVNSQSNQFLKQSSSAGSLDSQIYILDSGRKQQVEKPHQEKNLLDRVKSQPQQKEQKKQPEKQGLPTFNLPKNLNETVTKRYSLQHLKLQAAYLAQDKRLARIKLSLQSQAQKITLNLDDCLQPILVLQTSVSQSPGVYIDGNLYFGPFKHGRRNGFGLEVFPENEYYLGNFRDDMFHGEGFYFWNKNEYFLGLFQNGKKVFGHLYGPKLHYFGQFLGSKKMNGYGKAKFKNGQEHIGEWTQGKRNGIGQATEITKDKFIGYWQKGKRAGYGEHVSNGYPDQGYRLKAFWKEYEIISDAIIEYSNENVYEGGLNEDLQKHGKGLFTFKKGGYFKGTFYKDNATHGQLVYKNGEKYIGSLKNMKRHGFGEYHYLDGSIKKGNWIQDIRVQKEVDMSALK